MPAAVISAALTGAFVSDGASGAAAVEEGYTRFERARILGARALQVSLGAPILTETPAGLIDPVTIAEMEFAAGVIPITVRRGPRSS